MLPEKVIHLYLTNANLSCKGSKDVMAQQLHQNLKTLTPTLTGQNCSRSANQ